MPRSCILYEYGDRGLGRGMRSGRRLFEERLLPLDPRGEARPRQDRVDISERAGIARLVGSRVDIVEIGEGTGDGDVPQREGVADQESAGVRDHPLEIIEDRRQFLLLRLIRRGEIAGPAEEAR